MTSVIQKACHTPLTPKKRLKIKARGRIRTIYRIQEISNECMPFPMASRAPAVTTDTPDTANPMQIMRSARRPATIVSVLSLNR